MGFPKPPSLIDILLAPGRWIIALALACGKRNDDEGGAGVTADLPREPAPPYISEMPESDNADRAMKDLEATLNATGGPR